MIQSTLLFIKGKTVFYLTLRGEKKLYSSVMIQPAAASGTMDLPY